MLSKRSGKHLTVFKVFPDTAFDQTFLIFWNWNYGYTSLLVA